jgi:hypothetical protein
LPAEAKNNIIEALNTGLSGTIPLIKKLLSNKNEANEDYNTTLIEYPCKVGREERIQTNVYIRLYKDTEMYLKNICFY